MKPKVLTRRLARYGFRQIYNSIDHYGIRKGVDELGVDGFIKHCARLAASTGVISGLGGGVSAIIGIPIDLLNNFTQQFRVTLGVIYERRGNYVVHFDEFMSIVAVSVGVEAGVIVTRNLLEDVAEKLLIRMGASAGGRLIPIVGAVIGGTANYLLIKSVGASMKKLEL